MNNDEICVWTITKTTHDPDHIHDPYNGCETYETDCDYHHETITGTVFHDAYSYCPYCGGFIVLKGTDRRPYYE